MIKLALALVMCLAWSLSNAQLVIAICGHSEYECEARDDALNSTFGKPDTTVQAGASGAQLDVTNGTETERVPSTSDPALSVPAPSAPATAGSPVTSTCYSWTKAGYPNTPSMCSATANMAIQSCEAAGGFYSGGQCYANGTNYQSVHTSTTSTCPSGYSNVSGTCTLSDARAATPDTNSDFSRSGETLSTPSASDADTSIFLDNESVGKIVSGSYQRAGYSPAGNPAHLEVKPLAGGGSRIVYTESSGGVVRQTTLEVAPGGGVSSVASGTGTGTLTPSPGTGTAQVAAPPVIAAPGTGGGISSGLSAPTFPSDYSRSGEAAAAGQAIVSKLDEKLGDGSDPTDPVQPANSEFDQAFFQGTFTNLLGWQLPTHTSQCPTGSFDWLGQTFTMDSHCQLIADHFQAIAAAMAVVWTILALFILLSA